MSDISIQIVDENDQPVGQASMQEAWEKGLIHRISRIMIEDENGKILLQKRAADIRLYPDCWDPTAAGHVDAGEDYYTAATRELEEEMGIKGFPLQEAAYYHTNGNYKGLELNRFVKLYKAKIPGTTPVKIQEGEVAEAKWFSLEEMKNLAKEHPEKVSDGLAETIKRLYN